MKTDKNTLISVLKSAKKYIAQNGWIQGDLFGEDDNGNFSPKGPVCMLGALAKATQQYGTKINIEDGVITKESRAYGDAQEILLKAINKIFLKSHKKDAQYTLREHGLDDLYFKEVKKDWQSRLLDLRKDFKDGYLDKDNYIARLSEAKSDMAEQLEGLKKDRQEFFKNPDIIGDIPHFNDEYAKNVKEVLSAFDTAIALVKDIK